MDPKVYEQKHQKEVIRIRESIPPICEIVAISLLDKMKVDEKVTHNAQA